MRLFASPIIVYFAKINFLAIANRLLSTDDIYWYQISFESSAPRTKEGWIYRLIDFYTGIEFGFGISDFVGSINFNYIGSKSLPLS